VTWSFAFRLRRYLRESLWVVPLVAASVGLVVTVRVLIVQRRNDLRARPSTRRNALVRPPAEAGQTFAAGTEAEEY
jgi:hypothetical protein